MITASEFLIIIVLVIVPAIFLLVARKSDKRFQKYRKRGFHG